MSELQHIPNFKKANMMKIGSFFVKYSSYIYNEHATSLFLEKYCCNIFSNINTTSKKCYTESSLEPSN